MAFQNFITRAKRSGPEVEIGVSVRERQKRVHRQAILEAGERVLGAELPLSVAVDKIAAQAGLAKGTVYNYFAGKAALFEAITQNVETRTIERIERAMPDCLGGGARMAAAMGALFDTAARLPEQAVILERRLGATASRETLIGAVLLEELQRADCVGAERPAELRAALMLLLSAICCGMREIRSGGKDWSAAETQSLIRRCLVALGIGEERATLEA